MQFTLKLIDAVVLECECLTLAQHIFSAFPTWEKKHAEVIMQVKNDLQGILNNFSCPQVGVHNYCFHNDIQDTYKHYIL